jgi:hypothetical protein
MLFKTYLRSSARHRNSGRAKHLKPFLAERSNSKVGLSYQVHYNLTADPSLPTVQNFFEPQPEKNAAVYFLRLVLHDWPDNKAHEILRTLRASANDDTKLILFDMIVPHACAEDSPLPGAPVAPPPPPPLLPNFAVGTFITASDLQMLNLMNGMERTVAGFVDLGKETGWKLESFKPGPLTVFVFSVA